MFEDTYFAIFRVDFTFEDGVILIILRGVILVVASRM